MNTVQVQSKLSTQTLSAEIKLFSQLIKSLMLTLPKQGRRLLSVLSLQRAKNVMNQYVENQGIYKFIEYEEYTDLLSKQIQSRLNEQIFKKLLALQTKLQSLLYEGKMKEKENQLQQRTKLRLEGKGEKTITKQPLKPSKSPQSFTMEQLARQLEQLKKSFSRMWREDYFMVINYRMAIVARELQRWTEIGQLKVGRQKIEKQIDELFG